MRQDRRELTEYKDGELFVLLNNCNKEHVSYLRKTGMIHYALASHYDRTLAELLKRGFSEKEIKAKLDLLNI